MTPYELTSDQQQALEAATFRRLLAHLNARNDVQNIDLMNLAGFCRNCLSKWYQASATEMDLALEYETVRERIYGMPYNDWKEMFQKEASADQLQQLATNIQQKAE